MGKIPTARLQEVFFGSFDKKESAKVKTLEKAGYLKKIAPRIYTSNLEENAESIIRRNWYRILANHYPGALLSHRSALEFKPAGNEHIHLTYTYTTNVSLPGLTIHFVKGPGKIEGDKPFFEQLYVSQEARAFLENMQQTRKRPADSKTLSRKEIEEKLETYIRVKGDASFNAMRDRARAIAPLLGMDKEFKKLNGLMSDLLGTGVIKNLQSGIALSRVLGEPFDPDRIELFEILYHELATGTYPDLPDKNSSVTSYRNFAFFESYFSNYIEGTEFTLAEAMEIITTQTPLPARDEDSHDILGTYRIVSDKKEMSLLPVNPDYFLQLLRDRHAVLLSARTSKKPGEFKDRNNRAGNTEFVDWQLVAGTLKKGFDWYVLLQHPFAKAVYIMFLISEVHPFLDGNGRIARVLMNAELSALNLSKIIIPTVFREDYISALKKLTRHRTPDAYIRMMLRAYRFSSNIYGEDWDTMKQYLTASDAFKEPKEGKLKFAK